MATKRSEMQLYTPNVEQIRAQATRVVKGRIPAEVRKELMAAVKAGELGRLKRGGLKPEIFFHPDHLHGARERQQREAEYAVKCIAGVMASPAEVRAGIEAMGGDVVTHVLGTRGVDVPGKGKE